MSAKKQTHTPGPWRVYLKNGVLEIQDSRGNAVVFWSGFDGARQSTAEKEANARRIVVCVNLLEGTSTEQIESDWKQGWEPYGAAKHFEAERDALKALNTELVEVLTDLLERVDRNGGIGEYKGGPAFVVGKARALLARLETTKETT
jgi:hypothetical protein